MQFPSIVRRAALGLVAFAIVSISSTRSVADETLRWKLSAGDAIDYQLSQDMGMSVQSEDDAQMSTTFEQVINMHWNVKSVDAEGNAEIEQQFRRIQLNMNVPGSGQIAYDTDSDEPAVGMAAMFAPTMEAMTAGSFRFKMSPQGEVSDVEFSAELKQVIANGPGGEEGAAEQFKSMVSQVALVIPDRPLAAGDTWKTTNTVNSPTGGNQTVVTTYTYDGTREADGATLAVIKPSMDVQLGAGPMAQMKTKEQKTDGEVLFDVVDGRLHSISTNLNIDFDMTAQGATMPGTIIQKVDVTVSSGESEAAGSAATQPAESAAQ